MATQKSWVRAREEKGSSRESKEDTSTAAALLGAMVSGLQARAYRYRCVVSVGSTRCDELMIAKCVCIGCVILQVLYRKRSWGVHQFISDYACPGYP